MISIIPKEGRKGKISASPPTYYLSIVFITPSKEVSLESIFQVALLSHIFRPRRRGGKYKFPYEVPASSDFKSPEIRYYLPLCDLSNPTLPALERKRKYGTILL